MKKCKVIFRADGNSKIGLGHIFRVFALAEIIKEEFDCSLVVSEPNSFVLTEASKINLKVISLPKIDYIFTDKREDKKEVAFDLKHILKGNEIVVTDGYVFGTNYQRSIKELGCRLICVDDLAEWHFVADAIINHNPGFNFSKYDVSINTKLYTGLDYLIVRPVFFRPLEFRTNTNNVFISLGGADYFEFTKKILLHILSLDQINYKIHVLISDLFSETHKQSLAELSLQNQGFIFLHKNLSSTEVVNLLDSCRFGIVSASGVLLESYLRKLNLAVGYYAKNQYELYKYFVENELAIDLNNFDDLQNILHLITGDCKPKSRNITNSNQNLLELFRKYSIT